MPRKAALAPEPVEMMPAVHPTSEADLVTIAACLVMSRTEVLAAKDLLALIRTKADTFRDLLIDQTREAIRVKGWKS